MAATAPGARRRAKPTLVVKIPSETSYLALVRDLTKRMAEAAGFPEATADRLALAVDEATTNVIEHAYKGAADQEIELRFEDRGAEFRVEIIDTGKMVDPRTVPRVDIDRFVTEVLVPERARTRPGQETGEASAALRLDWNALKGQWQ